MKKEHMWLLVGYLVGSYFGLPRILGTLRSGVGGGVRVQAQAE